MSRFLALLFLAISTQAAFAWFPHGTSGGGGGTCPYGSAYADGCAAAPATGQVQFPNFFTDARQTGQAQYKDAGGNPSNHPPPWNVPGVDYPVGAYTADASLLDPTVTQPAGCSYNAGLLALQCSGSVTIAHYRLNGKNIYMPTGGSNATIEDIHQTMTWENCRQFGGQTPVLVVGPVSVTSSTFDFDATCQQTAALYKTTGDPGFVAQSSGTANISGTSLTYTGTPTGTVRLYQYIDCSGCTHPTQITAGSGLGPYTLSVSQSTLTGVTVTTGPVESVQNGAVGNSGQITALYNADLGWGQFLAPGTAVGDADIRFNFGQLTVRAFQHVNFAVKLPGPGTINSWVQNFNTVYWDTHSYLLASGGTSTFDLFATIDIMGGSTTTVLDQARNNVMIANNSTYPSVVPITNSMFRYLSQGGASNANINLSLASGVMTVTAFNSGNALAVGQYIACSACTRTTKITSLGTGTGGTGTYNVDNTVDSTTLSGVGVYLYPGIINTVDWRDNYGDMTGTNGGMFNRSDKKYVEVGTEIISGNINMVSGAACTTSSCP